MDWKTIIYVGIINLVITVVGGCIVKYLPVKGVMGQHTRTALVKLYPFIEAALTLLPGYYFAWYIYSYQKLGLGVSIFCGVLFSLILIVMCIAHARWKSNRKEGVKTSDIDLTLFQIRCDSLSESGVPKGWKLAGTPRFEIKRDGTFGRYLHIIPEKSPKDRYALDHDVIGQDRTSGKVGFLFKSTCAGVRYIGVKYHAKRDSKVEDGHIAVLADNSDPKPGPGDREWSIGVPPALHGEWAYQVVDIKNTFQETFGSDNWIFDEITKIRLRKEIKIVGTCFTS